MRLTTLKLKNFRGYRGETVVGFDDLTAFVGKNDVGKSTILEALDIFFNDKNSVAKIEKGDINKQSQQDGDTDICISACFSELPERIVIDSSNETSFSAEYLLNESSELEIVKKYPNGGTAKVYVRANHPKNPMCCDLLSKTNAELKKLLNEQHIDCDDRTKNACIRTAIWRHYSDDLQLEPTEIELSKGDGKSIKEKVLSQLPAYALFQADRKNCDGDSEIQDPLKVATKTIMQSPEVADKLAEVANLVRSQLRDVAQRTLDKLREMDQDVANSLTPVIPDDTLKW